MGEIIEIFCVVTEAVFSVAQKRGKPGCLAYGLALAVSIAICAGIVWAALWLAGRMA